MGAICPARSFVSNAGTHWTDKEFNVAIPMLDITGMHAPIRDELAAKLTEVLDSGSYIRGKYVEAFETELAAHVGAAQAVGEPYVPRRRIRSPRRP